jgi:hypothetical protein
MPNPGSFDYWQAGEQPAIPPDHVDSKSFDYWQAGEQPPICSFPASPGFELSASGISVSAGSAALFLVHSISASGISVSVGTADLTRITALMVTQVALQSEASSLERRVTAVGLQSEASSLERRVTAVGLQVDAKQQVDQQVTQAGLQVEGEGAQERVTFVGLQVDAKSIRSQTAVNCWEFHVTDRYGRYLAFLDGAYSKAYLAQLNDVGAGSFRIHARDPKATAENLSIGNIVLVRYHNVDVGAFVIEEVQEDLVSQQEAEGEEITVSGRGLLALLEDGIVYPLNINDPNTTERRFTGATRAEIFLSLYNEYERRGGGLLSVDFTAALDSAGRPWTDLNTLSYKAGQNLLEVVKNHTALGTDVTVGADRVLHYWQSAGRDRRDEVFFRHGQNILQCTRTRDAKDLTNVVLAEGQGILVESLDATSIASYGRREAYLLSGNTDNQEQVTAANNLLLQQLASPIESLRLVVLADEYFPLLSYELGDVVSLEVPGRVAGGYRILAISIREKGGPCDLEVTLEINSLALEYLVKLQKSLEASRQVFPGVAATGLAASDTRPVATSDHTHLIPVLFDWYVEGELAAGDGQGPIHRAPVDVQVMGFEANVKTAPGSQAIVDVEVSNDLTSWSSLFVSRPVILSGEKVSSGGTLGVTMLTAGQYVRFCVDDPGAPAAQSVTAKLLLRTRVI